MKEEKALYAKRFPEEASKIRNLRKREATEQNNREADQNITVIVKNNDCLLIRYDLYISIKMNELNHKTQREQKDIVRWDCAAWHTDSD